MKDIPYKIISRIYQGKDTYLRIGNPELIEKELELHRKFFSHGCPIPEILDEGKLGRQRFYIESSAGDMLLTYVFSEDFKKIGKISDHNFSIFLKLTEQFAEAQLSTMTSKRQNEDFYHGIYMNYILDDYPNLKDNLSKAFEKIKQSVSVFPVVLTHGDLSPHNSLRGGIIDFGYAFNGYAGYDLVGNVFHTYFFPKSNGYEKTRSYEFTEKQLGIYFQAMDVIYSKNGLPHLSEYLEDFLLAKAIWSSARITNDLKIKKWRFDLLEQITTDYLEKESIIETVKKFPS